jgi:hypothetical protein
MRKIVLRGPIEVIRMALTVYSSHVVKTRDVGR